jgi:hypothetical protein
MAPAGACLSNLIYDRLESDPLLDFLSEPDSQEPGEPDEAAPADSPEPLHQRVEKLERSIEASTRELIALRAQVATLVSATRDINRRVPQRPTNAGDGEPSRGVPYRTVSAITGVLAGIAVAFWLWTHYYDMDAVFMKAAPAAVVPASVVPGERVPEAAPAVAEPAQLSQDTSTPPPQPSSAAPAPVVSPEARNASLGTEYLGTLSIDASPGGEVFINREDAGATPLRLEKIKAGSHLIWIERDGYRRWTKVVEVPADRVSRVFATLEPIGTR